MDKKYAVKIRVKAYMIVIVKAKSGEDALVQVDKMIDDDAIDTSDLNFDLEAIKAEEEPS